MITFSMFGGQAHFLAKPADTPFVGKLRIRNARAGGNGWLVVAKALPALFQLLKG